MDFYEAWDHAEKELQAASGGERPQASQGEQPDEDEWDDDELKKGLEAALREASRKRSHRNLPKPLEQRRKDVPTKTSLSTAKIEQPDDDDKTEPSDTEDLQKKSLHQEANNVVED